jgi:hypothetical protein
MKRKPAFTAYTYTPEPPTSYDHAYVTCGNCHGSGMTYGSIWTSQRFTGPCNSCREKYEYACKRLGADKAEAERRILAIEAELLNDPAMPKEITRRLKKPLSEDGLAYVAAYVASELNREYLRNLKTWWS